MSSRRRLLWKTPCARKALICRLGQLDEHRQPRWIEPEEQGFEIVPGHGGTAGGAAVGAMPDMKKDARSASRPRCGAPRNGGVVIDHYSPAIGFANIAHMLGAIPVRRDGGAVDDPVIVLRRGVIDAFNGWSEDEIGQLESGWGLGRVAECGTQGENASGRLAIPLNLDRFGFEADTRLSSVDEADAPTHAFAANHDRDRLAHVAP